MLDLEILLRVAGVIATLIAVWLVGRIIKKGHAKLLKKEQLESYWFVDSPAWESI